MSRSDNILWLESFPKLGSPRGEPLSVRESFQEDEATWFRRAIEQGLFLTRKCVPSCPRRKRCRESGPDEFVPAHGKSGLRHLFSLSNPIALNREYIPHVAAVGRLVLGEGHNQACSSFSLYRQFTRDLIHKKKGGS
jgi:hypothetical protein